MRSEGEIEGVIAGLGREPGWGVSWCRATAYQAPYRAGCGAGAPTICSSTIAASLTESCAWSSNVGTKLKSAGACKQKSMPRHVGIILDGNPRHARKQGLSDPGEIYQRGAERLDDILDWCTELHIPAVTFWVFSPR